VRMRATASLKQCPEPQVPFCFTSLWTWVEIGRLPTAHVYCCNLELFIEYARPLRRYFTWRAMELVVIDWTGSIRRFIGATLGVGPNSSAHCRRRTGAKLPTRTRSCLIYHRHKKTAPLGGAV
jgi:hypothetical protein